MLERLRPARPQVVFVTAFSEHAVDAFDARAVDYLVKPVAPDRLHVRCNACAPHWRAATPRPAPQYPERLALSDGPRLRMVAVARHRMRARAGQLCRTAGRRPQPAAARDLPASIARLDPQLFARIHRSRIVRVDLIEQIEAPWSGQYVVRMRSGLRITSGAAIAPRCARRWGFSSEAPESRVLRLAPAVSRSSAARAAPR